MNTQTINIATSIDDNYVKYCIVMLTSLFENNKNCNIHIYLLCDSLQEETKSLLNSVVIDKYNQLITYHNIDKESLKESTIDKKSKMSITTYYRLFLETIVGKDVSKIIYLDSDLIVVDNILDLWNYDISNYAIGCVEDMWSSKEDNFTRLNYDKSYSYFNAGVLLINLEYWRNIHFQELAINYFKNNSDKLKFNDQDILNALFHDKKLFLPFRWNLQNGFYRKKRKIRKESINELNKEIKRPVIIHFTGWKKPWTNRCEHPLKNEYFKYLDLTKWKGERPIIPLKYKINKFFSFWENKYIKIK